MSAQSQELLEHLFRHQSGRMVAHLTRLLGPAHIDLAEETVQETMIRALQSWPYHGIPENPAAWLFRAARNLAIDLMRRHRMMDEKPMRLRPSFHGETSRCRTHRSFATTSCA